MKKKGISEEHPQELDEVLSGDSSKHRDNGHKMADPFLHDYEAVERGKDILEIPAADNFPAILASSNINNEEDRSAYIIIIQRLLKFNKNGRQAARLEFMRMALASTLGLKAFGKTLQLQNRIELMAPSLLREQLALKSMKSKENTVKSSDYRPEVESKEPGRES